MKVPLSSPQIENLSTIELAHMANIDNTMESDALTQPQSQGQLF